VVGGKTAQAVVMLDRATRGIPVLRSSSRTLVKAIKATTSAKVSSQSRVYKVYTRPVKRPTRVQITATWNRVSKKATLLLLPPPDKRRPVFRRGTVRRGLTPTVPRAEKEEPPEPRPRPNRRALLVLLENGGIASTIELCCEGLDTSELPPVPVAICGTEQFTMRPGENPLQMINRVRRLIQDNPQMLNPMNWEVQVQPFDQWLNTYSDLVIEDSVKAVQAMQTSGKYHKVVTLEDEQFTTDRILEELEELGSGYQIDIHILSHGGNGYFIGHDGHQVGSEFFDRLKDLQEQGGGQPYLRAVYQMNCRSGTLTDDWLEVGAKTVGGTNGNVNNYMPQQYFHFMGYWRDGKSFDYAIRHAYDDAKFYTEPVYVHIIGRPHYLAHSVLLTSGRKNLRVTSR
jgi:hypothetical protein